MFAQILTRCWNNYQQMNCCHNDGRKCYCYDCLKPGFYVGGSDEYDCHKKMNFYVLKYGPSYISEIYYCLSVSQILERFKNSINILSLGCSFSPDYYAISKYIADNNLHLTFQYYGWDINQFWNTTRLTLQNIVYQTVNLLMPFPLKYFQLIIANKLFSTLYRHNNHNVFLINLVSAIGSIDFINQNVFFEYRK